MNKKLKRFWSGVFSNEFPGFNQPVAPTRSVAFILVFVGLLLVKSLNIIGNPQFWAEDGKVFFSQARELGWSSLFTPYAGYFHLCARMLALIASFFNAENAPVFYFWFSFAAHLVVILCVFHSPLFARERAKWLAASALVCIPLGSEVFFNVTNIHWLLAVLLPLMTLDRPCDRFDRRWLGRTIAVALLGLTDPYIVVFSPLFVLRTALLRKHRPEWCFGLVALLCAIVQITTIILSMETVDVASTAVAVSMTAHEKLRGYVAAPVRYVLGMYLFPWKCYVCRDRLSIQIVVLGIVTGIVLFFGFAVSALLLFRKMWRQLVFCGVVVLAALVAGTARGPLAYGADRYYYLPFVFTAFALIGMVTEDRMCVISKERLPWPIVLSRVLLGIYFICAASVYVLPQLEDLHWRDEYRKAVQDPQHEIPIHPTDNPTWKIKIPSRTGYD